MYRAIFVFAAIAIVAILLGSMEQRTIVGGTALCRASGSGDSVVLNDDGTLFVNLHEMTCTGPLVARATTLTNDDGYFGVAHADSDRAIAAAEALIHHEPFTCAVELQQVSVWMGMRFVTGRPLRIKGCAPPSV